MSAAVGRSSVALIVPTYQYGAYIGDLLASITQQSLAPDEVVVVDDGSSDDTADVVTAYLRSIPESGTSWRFIPQEHRGLVAAVRTGLATSSSELFARVDADDLLAPQFVERLVEALQRHPNAAYAYPAMRLFGEAEGRYHTAPFDPARLVVEGNFISAAALVRRTAYDSAGGLQELPAWEDWDLWLRMLAAGHVGVLVDEELYSWRRHGNSRNQLAVRLRLGLRLRMWARHPGLVARSGIAGLPHLARRVRHPVRQQ